MLPEKLQTDLARGQAGPPGREETLMQRKVEIAAEAVQGQHAAVLQKREVIILDEAVVREVLRVVPVIPGPALLPAVEVEQIKAPVQVVLAPPKVVEAAVGNLLVQEEVRHGI